MYIFVTKPVFVSKKVHTSNYNLQEAKENFKDYVSLYVIFLVHNFASRFEWWGRPKKK